MDRHAKSIGIIHRPFEQANEMPVQPPTARPPLLAIKPYGPQFDVFEIKKIGWRNEKKQPKINPRIHVFQKGTSMKKIQILGTGCPKCKKLAENAEAAAKELGIEYQIEKITQINDIMKMGVMMTPALAVDGTVKIVGKVASPEEIKPMLS